MSIPSKPDSRSKVRRAPSRFAVILVMSLGLSLSQGAPNPGTYLSYRRPPYVYLYAGKDLDVIEELDRDLRKLVPDMELHLGTRLPDRVQIELPMTRTEFAWLSRGRVPSWAGGVAYPSEGRIVVKTPQFFGEGVPLSILTCHELAHILLNAASSGKGLPRWFDEGFSQVLSGESRAGSLTLLARAALADRMMGLPRVEDVLSYSDSDAQLAYAESHAAARGMLDRFGWEVVRSILFLVGSGAEFDSAFESSAGVEYEAWQADWLESAQQKFKNYAFLDLEMIIWVAIMLLSALAAFMVWLRKKRQFKKWAEEEEEELFNESPEIEAQEPVDDKPIHP